ncbi:MAG: FAD-dependent oxidoreductase [Anaerolineales bacterium]|nr:FAD-dependent oxidoreductase [Anaerolineales bacterium]
MSNVDNFSFHAAELDTQKISGTLRGSHIAGVDIVGGGYTGLSAACYIRKHFPRKHIVLLEGARCGYCTSGRNGGFCINTRLLDWHQTTPERRKKDFEVSAYGLNHIKRMISKFGADCKFEENGALEAALNDKHVNIL